MLSDNICDRLSFAQSRQTYSVKTRTCSVTIFKSLLSAINEHVPSKEEKSKLLDPVLPVFINKLVLALAIPSGQQSSFAMKTEIIKGTPPSPPFLHLPSRPRAFAYFATQLLCSSLDLHDQRYDEVHPPISRANLSVRVAATHPNGRDLCEGRCK